MSVIEKENTEPCIYPYYIIDIKITISIYICNTFSITSVPNIKLEEDNVLIDNNKSNSVDSNVHFMQNKNAQTIVDYILYLLDYNLIITYNKGDISRLLLLPNMNINMYNNIKNDINIILGFDICSRDRYYVYSINELNAISIYFKDLYLSYAQNYNKQTINYISYRDLYLKEHINDLLYKNTLFNIIKVMYESIDLKHTDSKNIDINTYVKYDSICGFDILIIIMIKIYYISCKKISRIKYDILKNKKTQEIFI